MRPFGNSDQGTYTGIQKRNIYIFDVMIFKMERTEIWHGCGRESTNTPANRRYSIL